MPMSTHTDVVVRSDIWLPPLRASLPNICIVAASRDTNSIMGMMETIGEGVFFILLGRRG